MYLDDWRLSVVCDVINGRYEDATGTCDKLLDYKSALITINYPKIRDEQHLVQILTHELIHVLIAPFDLLVTSMNQYVPEGAQWKSMDRIREHVIERICCDIEQVLHKHRPKDDPCSRCESAWTADQIAELEERGASPTALNKIVPIVDITSEGYHPPFS